VLVVVGGGGRTDELEGTFGSRTPNLKIKLSLDSHPALRYYCTTSRVRGGGGVGAAGARSLILSTLRAIRANSACVWPPPPPRR
jgi:hypothetical protein